MTSLYYSRLDKLFEVKPPHLARAGVQNHPHCGQLLVNLLNKMHNKINDLVLPQPLEVLREKEEEKEKEKEKEE